MNRADYREIVWFKNVGVEPTVDTVTAITACMRDSFLLTQGSL